MWHQRTHIVIIQIKVEMHQCTEKKQYDGLG